MNRDKALFIADRIMTRIETDKAIHKDAIADEIQAADVIDVISYDKAKGQWVHRDGKPLDVGNDRVEPLPKRNPLAFTVADGPNATALQRALARSLRALDDESIAAGRGSIVLGRHAVNDGTDI